LAEVVILFYQSLSKPTHVLYGCRKLIMHILAGSDKICIRDGLTSKFGLPSCILSQTLKMPLKSKQLKAKEINTDRGSGT